MTSKFGSQTRMEPEIVQLLQEIKELWKTYRKSERAVPNPSQAETNANLVLSRVLTLLEQDVVAAELDELIDSARSQLLRLPQTTRTQLQENRDELISRETQATSLFLLKPADIDELVDLFLVQHLDSIGNLLSSSDDLKSKLPAIHGAIVKGYKSARSKPRKQKKSRKRKIAQGAFRTTTGISLIAVDTALPELATFSYALGGSALLQAGADFIGESAE
ncbi:hypothetical protein [Gloeocapsopsis dulcis]|uniref:Uncharacterized protein n=1 Tax=Gloeocapsopsis dulcis AAB1 = 1H9 TaxID=1433147 RepID=A0A6N8G3U6_9CHRO|nr:hypothetical protein [Gloeocapsopsis dulcis]MUL39504.1 hypothetical protein [Gloeocapsopsis dulcis AAB1 = 1H9]WNN92163.1 hypothetical protein P0S91_26670 [Gloeocapsopsis dulcis]